jgi:hypothetical protein
LGIAAVRELAAMQTIRITKVPVLFTCSTELRQPLLWQCFCWVQLIFMSEFILKDGVKYFRQRKLEIPKRDDFFEATGEVKFGGMYQETGHFDDWAFQQAQKEHWDNCSKNCENKAGYFCKNKKCNYPKCLS